MDKSFFEAFERRKGDFAGRAGFDGDVRAEIVLNTGRTYAIETIVEAADGWLHLDGRDPVDETVRVSVTVPYHQINLVLFTRPRRLPRAGFGG